MSNNLKHQEWLKNNKDKVKKTSREYYLKNKDKLKEKHKEWLEKNKNKTKEKHKEYVLKNKDRIKEKSKEWLEKNKEILKEKSKEYYQKNKDKIDKEYKKEYLKQYRLENIDIIKEKSKKYYDSFVLWEGKHTDKIKLYEEIRQNGDYLEVKCAYCGKWFVPRIDKMQSRLQSINGSMSGENRFYCSNNCKKECPIFKQIKYPKKFKKSTSREVQPELRQMVLERDNYTCQKCNKTQDELKVGLHCHHKEGILWEPLLSADMDMCITLCKTCHKEVHKIDGCKTSDMKCDK